MNNQLIAYSVHAKRQAKQIVREKFDDVLCGNFRVPTSAEMEYFLKDVIEYDFDEYEESKKVRAKNPSWSDSQVKDEIYSLKERYDSEYQAFFRQACLEAINEVENLLNSLRDALKGWKIENLE